MSALLRRVARLEEAEALPAMGIGEALRRALETPDESMTEAEMDQMGANLWKQRRKRRPTAPSEKG